MEQRECSETSEYKIQIPGNYPEENIQHSEHSESWNQENLLYFSIFSTYLFTPRTLTMRQPSLRKRQTIYLFDKTDFYFIGGNSSWEIILHFLKIIFATQNFIIVFATTWSLHWYRSLRVEKLHPFPYLLRPV